MFKLTCPIQKSFLWNGSTCLVNQFFGENKNRLFYGPEGHSGWDLKTQGHWKYKRHYENWKKVDRDKYETAGRIPIVAAHDGVLRTILYDDKHGMGWGVTVTSDVLQEKGQQVQYKTVYWHIETPWGSLKKFGGRVKSIKDLIRLFTGKQVRRRGIIAIGGNNGKSTGPHLHFSLKKRVMRGGKWSSWQILDPLPHMQDKEVIYHRYYGPGYSEYVYKGKKITRTKFNSITKSFPKVV